MADAARHGRGPAGLVAVVYGSVGDTDRAVEWFERAYEERTVLGAEDLRTDPLRESVRADARCPELLRKFDL